jgi:hypothetical protein
MLVDYKKVCVDRKFGIEAEVEASVDEEFIANIISSNSNKSFKIEDGWSQTCDNNYWHIKYDSTCGPLGKPYDHGWEVASYIGSNYSDLKHISNVIGKFKKNGIKINQNCGLHFHINIDDFSFSKAGILIANWIKIENVLSHAVPSHRRNNKECLLLSKKYIKYYNSYSEYDPYDFWNCLKPRSLVIHENEDKKVAMNMVNYAQNRKYKDPRPTVEFRFPEGTLSSEDIMNWGCLFSSFVKNAKNSKMPKNLIYSDLKETLDILGLSHPNKFYILDKRMHKVKMWFLKRIKKFATKQENLSASADKLLNLMCEV